MIGTSGCDHWYESTFLTSPPIATILRSPSDPSYMSSPLIQFVGYWVETLVYGIYLTTCVSCIRALLRIHVGSEMRWRTRREVKLFFVVVGISLFVVSTFHIVAGLLQTLQFFVGGNDHHVGPVLAYNTYSSNGPTWIIIARFITQIIQSLLGDLVLVYRCLIVYGPGWKLLLPSVLLYIADVALAVTFIFGIILALDGTAISAPLWLYSVWMTFLLVAALQNILSTSLLIWRIWKVDQQARKLGGIFQPASQRSLRHVVQVLAECGLCYTTMIVLTFVASYSAAMQSIPSPMWHSRPPGLHSISSSCRQLHVMNAQRGLWKAAFKRHLCVFMLLLPLS
ncbi:hypothetical protein R3P38DRAFT_3055979, partial [Favolaschia claudopus]